jgi:hypothetical protein
MSPDHVRESQVLTRSARVKGMKEVVVPMNARVVGYRTGNTTGQKADTVPVPANTIPIMSTGTQRPVNTAVRWKTPWVH